MRGGEEAEEREGGVEEKEDNKGLETPLQPEEEQTGFSSVVEATVMLEGEGVVGQC